MGKQNDDGGYCKDILKAGLTESDMSAGGRAFSIFVGLIGSVTVDPVLWICKKCGAEGRKDDDDFDPSDPTNPMNSNY